MLYRLKLKNAKKTVVISDDSYEMIKKNRYLTSIDFINNLRIHSSGYAFFQKNFPKPNGTYKSVTIYLHRYIAEKLVDKPKSRKKLNVTFKNGDRLDCRTKNLIWATRSHIVRNTDYIGNKNGYRGITKEKNGYRAAIYTGKTRHELGVFPTAEEAALAYNKKSIELFGRSKSLNKIPADILTKIKKKNKRKAAKN